MSIESEINRINNNVNDALAATAEKGATVPEGANSDDLGTLIRSIPTGGSSLPPLRIRLNGTETSISWGLGEKYTAAELYEIADTRDIVMETRGLVNSQYLYGYYRYSRGTDTVVDFDGWYETPAKRRVPASMQINASGNVTVSRKMFAEGTLPTDPTLNVSGSAADSKTVGTKFKEISEQIANMGGGGGVDVTAKVGQTIVVKEVDADGKPTAWESADYQPRTHWSEFSTVEILPEATVEIDPDDGSGALPVDFLLEPNKPYTIKHNGVEYAGCVGVNVYEGVIAFGNLGVMDESLPVTEHPFLLISQAVSIDGNYDYTLGVVPLDGSETVTLSISGEEEIAHKIPGKYLPDGVLYAETKMVDVLPETTIVFEYYEDFGMPLAIVPLTAMIREGVVYTVTFNGVSYNNSMDKYGNLGNAIINDGEDTGEPYVIAPVPEDGYMLVVPLIEITEATLSIQIEEKTPIDKGYLPNDVVYGVSGIKSYTVFSPLELHHFLTGTWAGENMDWHETNITDEGYSIILAAAENALPITGGTGNGSLVGNSGITVDGEIYFLASYLSVSDGQIKVRTQRYQYRRNEETGVVEAAFVTGSL